MTGMWVWLAVAALCVVAEVLTVNFIFFMIAAGAVAGALADLAGLSAPWQILIAAAVAAAGLLLVRPVMVRRLSPGEEATATNVDALIGRTATAVETVTDESGLARVNGETWSARVPAGSASIPVGSRARIARIDGVYLVLGDAPEPRQPNFG